MVGDNFMPEMHEKQTKFIIVHAEHLLEINKKYKHYKKKKILGTFTEIN